jgi:FkbM family methyltransferase
MKQKIWKIIYAVFRNQFFEKILKLFVSGKFSDAFITRFIPPFETYQNPTYRIAKKGSLRLHANLNDYNDWKAYWGILEYERQNLYKLAEKAKTVIDIGTNNGWVLLNIAKIISKNGGFIYGFEPFPGTYNRCIENIRSSGITNAQVFNKGCGETESSFKMKVVAQTNSGQNRIVDENIEQQANIVEVFVTTLDNQLRKIEKIDLIKIDVEGFELHVLKGAENLLTKYRPIIFIEINDPLLKANKTTPWEVLNLLKTKYNYKLTSALNGKLIDNSYNFDNTQLDIICYPV